MPAMPAPLPSDEGSPLSWFQQRLWVHYERSPDDTSYNLPFPTLIRGDLDIPALEQSVNIIAARHESLRTLYGETEDGEPVQFVTSQRYVWLPVVSVDRTQLLEHLDRFLEHRFDLRRGPIFVASLLKLPSNDHLLLFNIHHIAADAWSLKAILKSELQSAYAAFCRGQQPLLPPLTTQYKEYARKQRSSEQSVEPEHYWTEVLKGYEDSLELPTTYSRQLKSESTSGTFVYRYPVEFSRELERLSRENGCTMFMCLLAALAVTISRYADKGDLCIGTTTSNRSDVDLEPLIGFFVNILPLRMRIDEESTVADLLKAVRNQVLGAFEHPAPFERILQVTDVANRSSKNPLVPVVIRHQNFPQTSSNASLPLGTAFESWPEADEKDEGILKLWAREHVPARCELELSYAGDADGLAVETVFAANLYDRATIERLLNHHQHVLEGMFRSSSKRVLELPMLRDADVAGILQRNDGVPTTEAPTASFVGRFDAQVERAPEAVACWDAKGAWSFLDIGRRSESIAHALTARGTVPGDLVAVCLPRGGELLATLLGIWRVGAAYVPIDPAYPATYSRLMLDDASPNTIVCGTTWKHQVLPDVDDAKWLQLEQITHLPEDASREQLQIHPDSLAYVMYTSGSTGKPKGARVPHRQLNNWLDSLEAHLPFQPGEVVGQKTTSVFAAGVKEIFAGLLNGCPQVTIDDATMRDIPAFVDVLARHRVSRLNLLPSHLAGMMEHLRATGKRLYAMRVVVTAGEPLSKALVLSFRELFPEARLFNNYGCTEVNDITYYDTANLDTSQHEFVPMGTPIANTKVYVLDRYGRLVPDGVAGELHVASVGLPDGYHGLDELTAERFAPNPFGSVPSTRLYNTGDVVKRLPDGSLDYIGRWDFQAKIRGFRIDVRQVEQVMSDFPGIRSRAIVGQGDRLTAFYTSAPDQPVQMGDLRSFLQEKLPNYMVPDTFVLLEAMPQLPNGKLNRRALRDTQGIAQQSGSYEPPVTPTERALAKIWGVVVNVPAARIGRQTNFFEIGGHSLSAMRVLARIKDTFRVELPLSNLFDQPRLETIAAAIDREKGESPDLPAPSMKPRAGVGLLDGKVALVTGGSRGIGMSTALLLAEQGAKVAINYRDSEAQALDVKSMIESAGGVADVFPADVTSAEDVNRMVSAVCDKFGHIDILVANAHVQFRKQPFLTTPWADIERKVNDELKAIFHPCQAVAPGMVKRRTGSIIAMSSTLSKRSQEGFLAQSTAKAALDAFVRSLSSELGPFGIRCNTLAPGLTLTDAAIGMPAYRKEKVANMCPMRRNALPEDMAGAVIFFASDLSQFMTGTYMPIDGGFTTL
ncbi:hypothetical protein OQA88_3259 [Cercophora sp. LCS_1]